MELFSILDLFGKYSNILEKGKADHFKVISMYCRILACNELRRRREVYRAFFSFRQKKFHGKKYEYITMPIILIKVICLKPEPEVLYEEEFLQLNPKLSLFDAKFVSLSESSPEILNILHKRYSRYRRPLREKMNVPEHIAKAYFHLYYPTEPTPEKLFFSKTPTEYIVRADYPSQVETKKIRRRIH